MDPLYDLFQGMGARAETVRAKPAVAGWLETRASAAGGVLAAIRSHTRHGMVGGRNTQLPSPGLPTSARRS